MANSGLEPLLNATLSEATTWATYALQTAGCDSPRLDTELLLASCLGISRSQLHIHWQDRLTPAVYIRFYTLIQRRIQREPVAYILGRRAFYDLELEVSPATLIPRPETELLVEEAISWCQRQGVIELWAADVGTGSGAIAIALARHIPTLHVCAIDRSEAALAVAERNVQNYGLQDRVKLVVADLLEGVSRRFDLIV
jgi:release factor glutamine methyltransferase